MLQKDFCSVQHLIYCDLKKILDTIHYKNVSLNRFQSFWAELNLIFKEEPQKNENQLLLVFKNKKVVGCCLFSVLKNHEGISLLIRKQFVKWSQKEHLEILNRHLLYICNLMRATTLCAKITNGHPVTFWKNHFQLESLNS